MKIIVDTNIVFSAILNSSSSIGKLLIGSKNHFEFYTCDFLRLEILKHRKKLQTITGLSSNEIAELESLVTENITFINEKLIPYRIISETEILLAKIDINDTPFVALTRHLKGKLWTGDKKLINGLKAKKFKNTLTTKELSALLDKLER